MNADLLQRIERLEEEIAELTLHLIEHHQINCFRNLINDTRESKCL